MLCSGSALLSRTNKQICRQESSSGKPAQKKIIAQKDIVAQKSGTHKSIDNSKSTSARRRIFRTTKSKTVIGSDAFTNLKMFSENNEADLIEAKRTVEKVDKNNRNTDEKHKLLTRTRSAFLDNDKSLRKSLLSSRLDSSLDNQPRDPNDNTVRVTAQVHQQGELVQLVLSSQRQVVS